MKRLWLIVLMLAPLAVLAQQVLVSGTVVDDKSGNPLRQVSVSAGRVSVVTNEDGVFALKLEKQPSAIKVSHVGYKTRQVKLSQENTQGLKVRLVPTTIQLREIVVRTANPRELVDIAISKIPENYSKVPELLKAFYRETAMKRKHYIYVAEGVEDMYKTPYTRSVHRDRVSIVKGRRLLSQKQGDTLGVKVLAGPQEGTRGPQESQVRAVHHRICKILHAYSCYLRSASCDCGNPCDGRFQNLDIQSDDVSFDILSLCSGYQHSAFFLRRNRRSRQKGYSYKGRQSHGCPLENRYACASFSSLPARPAS